MKETTFTVTLVHEDEADTEQIAENVAELMQVGITVAKASKESTGMALVSGYSVDKVT